jgi:hypothetical protein
MTREPIKPKPASKPAPRVTQGAQTPATRAAAPKGVQGAQTPGTRAAAAQVNALNATRKQDKFDNQEIQKIKTGKIKYVPPVNIPKIITPTAEVVDDPGSAIQEVVATPVESVVATTGLVDGVNYKDLYLKEIERLVLSLVKNAKSLLIRYNFSGIDRVPESYLDFDREAKTETLASSFSRPESPFTLEEADLQERFSTDLNEINNLISDLSNSAEKAKYFGSMRGGTFLPREVKLLRNGSVGYDMRLEFTSISNQDFVVKCYEVS